METFLVKQVKGKDLKEGDEVWTPLYDESKWMKYSKEVHWQHDKTFLVKSPIKGELNALEKLKEKVEVMVTGTQGNDLKDKILDLINQEINKL